jgi:hypothetical protein
MFIETELQPRFSLLDEEQTWFAPHRAVSLRQRSWAINIERLTAPGTWYRQTEVGRTGERKKP